MPSPQPSISSPGSSTSSASTSSISPAPRGGRTRVSAEHTLNRVRENQRRHRARQRDHVASLEQKLAETEALLAEARAEIASLKEQHSLCVKQQQQVVVDEGVVERSYVNVEDGGVDGGHMSLDIDVVSALPLSLPLSSPSL
ncbi:hypothetical protein A1F96_08307 [Pyrenophora tritici-repentis]|nr:hypothetical protein A1F96_08307 [Pyrenophora tritici-repentis]